MLPKRVSKKLDRFQVDIFSRKHLIGFAILICISIIYNLSGPIRFLKINNLRDLQGNLVEDPCGDVKRCIYLKVSSRVIAHGSWPPKSFQPFIEGIVRASRKSDTQLVIIVSDLYTLEEVKTWSSDAQSKTYNGRYSTTWGFGLKTVRIGMWVVNSSDIVEGMVGLVPAQWDESGIKLLKESLGAEYNRIFN